MPFSTKNIGEIMEELKTATALLRDTETNIKQCVAQCEDNVKLIIHNQPSHIEENIQNECGKMEKELRRYVYEMLKTIIKYLLSADIAEEELKKKQFYQRWENFQAGNQS